MCHSWSQPATGEQVSGQLEHQTAGIAAQSTGNLGMPKTPQTSKMVSHHPQSTVFLECRMNFTTGKWDCMRKQMYREINICGREDTPAKSWLACMSTFGGGAWVSLRLCASIWVVTEGGIWFVQSFKLSGGEKQKGLRYKKKYFARGKFKKKKRKEKKQSKMWSQCRNGRNQF